jgi:phosphoglycolate phosphatase
VAGDDLPQQKPHAVPLLHIAREQGVEPNELVMIGDGPQDIQCGRAVGALCVGVVLGMRSPDAMLAVQPDHVVKRFADLFEILVV